MGAETTPTNKNPFGQVTGGKLTVKGVLFEAPLLWAMFDGNYDSHFDNWALSLDDITTRDSVGLTDTFFLPLIQSSDASEKRNLTICGIFVQRVRSQGHRSSFERVGFAIVDEEDGDIANSGWYLKQWISPPWPEELETTIDII